jgi:hypothetical protein
MLKAPTFTERTRVLARLLRISQVCFKLRDFTACSAVLRALESIESKLKNTWKVQSCAASRLMLTYRERERERLTRHVVLIVGHGTQSCRMVSTNENHLGFR